MRSALATASEPAGRRAFRRPAAWLAAGSLLLALAGCAGMEEPEEDTVLTTRSGETSIEVTESTTEQGQQVVRVRTTFRGEESMVTLNIDEPVYEVEIPLSIRQQRPAGAPADAGEGGAGAGSRRFEDILIAQYLEKAQQHMLDGDYNAALRQVNLVLNVNPDHVQALTMKGSIYYAMGNYQLANEQYERVLALDPSNQEVRKFQEFLRNQQQGRQPELPGVQGGAAPRPPEAPPGQAPAPPEGGSGGGNGGSASREGES